MDDTGVGAMRHTTQVGLGIGGAVFITYDSEKKDFERDMGDILLDAGDIQ